ncbi:hypothetical protein [Mucilaginibacter sp.]|jgi:uncharacterized membrane protein SirB2|uniref:hypothetical protein n=1 Tax=Mucilaginibacter sp. TaxID=1882438 RepID=UPI00356729D8
MNTQTLLPALLTLHLTGLILMAGTTVIDYVTFSTFWKQFQVNQTKSLVLLEATSKFARINGIGAALLILTGIGMMALTHGIFGEQLWFRIKFALVIIIILNALLVSRRQSLKLRKHITDTGSTALEEINKAKANLYRFYFSQFLLLFLVIFLSVFKFN